MHCIRLLHGLENLFSNTFEFEGSLGQVICVIGELFARPCCFGLRRVGQGHRARRRARQRCYNVDAATLHGARNALGRHRRNDRNAAKWRCRVDLRRAGQGHRVTPRRARLRHWNVDAATLHGARNARGGTGATALGILYDFVGL